MTELKTVGNYVLRSISTNQITLNPDNPRIVNEKSKSFQDLIDSIKAMGIKVPVQVRTHPKQVGKFQLLAGERRILAAGKIGLESVPALNHGTISDEAAFDITFAENFARENLTPLEEGKAVVTLMVKYKGDTEAVASKMGKSITWVLQRRAINNNLSPGWKKAIIEDATYKHWTVSHLQRVAALPKNVQDEILEGFGNDEDVITIKALEKEISERLMQLDKALWDRKDITLLKAAKDCASCKKRSSFMPGLFDDTTDKKTACKNDRCLDRSCWEEKTTAWLKKKYTELKATHPGVVFIATKHIDYWDQRKISSKFIIEEYRVIGNGDWKASKEGAKDAVPALVVFGSDIGIQKWITIKQSNVSALSSKSTSKTTGKPTPLKERRVLLNKKRWFVTIRELIIAMKKTNSKDLVTKDPILTVMALTVMFGTGQTHQRGWKRLASKSDKKTVLSELWQMVRATIISNLTYCGAITQTPGELIAAAKAASKLCGINITPIFKKVSKEVYPEPKSWSVLNEDGTPKKTVAKVKSPAKKKPAKKKQVKK